MVQDNEIITMKIRGKPIFKCVQLQHKETVVYLKSFKHPNAAEAANKARYLSAEIMAYGYGISENINLVYATHSRITNLFF